VFLCNGIIASVGNKRTLPTLHKSENYARAEYILSKSVGKRATNLTGFSNLSGFFHQI